MKTLRIPSADYHADTRSGRFIASHALATFRESPALYNKVISGEVAETESPALAFGRAAHCLILEGPDAFDENYLVADGPVNGKTGEPFGKNTKAYADWASRQGREVISTKDFAFIGKLRKSVMDHPAAAELLSCGEAEGVVRTELEGVPCQIRMDWFSERHGLSDLKTTDALKWFEGDCKRFGYLYQMAFYRAVLRKATGVTVPVHLIAVEKSEPSSAGVWKISDDILDQAEMVNSAALRRLAECRSSGVWPTGYEEIRIIATL